MKKNVQFDLEALRESAAQAEGMLKALANRHRLIILCQLVERENKVGDLATLLGIRESTVSQHLALLRRDGFVTTRREGQMIWYALGNDAVRQLICTLYEIYCGKAACAKRPRRSKVGRK